MRRKTSKKRKRIYVSAAILLTAAMALGAAGVLWLYPRLYQKPDQLLTQYMDYIEKQDYKSMYAMLSEDSRDKYPEEEFIARNQNIYEGAEITRIETEVKDTVKEKSQVTVSYRQKIACIAGEIQFDSQAVFIKKKGYHLQWNDHMIFPNLGPEDKVRVSTLEARRGAILDRNGTVLAGQGTSASVGLVPGKLRADILGDMDKLAELLELTPEGIQKKLEAKWVKEDSLVPIATLPKVTELDLASQDEEALENQALQEALLQIPGVMLSDVETRVYPQGKSTSHLTGYVQNVTAEDLEKHEGEGYHANSVIGRSGMEGLYEKELKGKNGYKVQIVDSEGREKETLAYAPKEDGQDIKLTIDISLQESLYEQFQEDKGCSVAMNPYTGEVLALVSTPTFDSNDFIRGLSEKKWTALNEDESKPLYNRYRQALVPGSSFKPIIAGIGLATGALDPGEDYGSEGTSWQKDASWGDYYVTTLHTSDPATLENALIYSDNIYFAKAALRIGAQPLEKALDDLGFGQELPFEITMAKSQYTNGDSIESEVLLADSGYGQGQILVNPLHLAALYTSFINEGNVIKPYLRYQDTPKSEIWMEHAFTPEAADLIREGLVKAVNTPEGTGYGARREDIILGGKTGTAEIKASKEDTTGTELGWFGVFTTEPETEQPLLLLSMAEDVKDRGGSGYVVERVKQVLDQYFIP